MNVVKSRQESCNSLQTSSTKRGIYHISQIVFWLEFICFMVCMTWHFTYHTTVSFLKYNQLHQVLELVTVLAIFNIIFLCGYSRKQLLEIILLLLLLAISRYNSQNDDGYLLYSMAIAFSCRHIYPNELIKKLFCIYLAVFFGVLFLYRMGIFSTLVSEEGRFRMNFGFSHYNTMGMVIMCIVMLWILLRYEKIRWFDYIVWLGSAVFVMEVPNSRAAALCIFLLTIGVFFSKFFNIFQLRSVKAIAFFIFPAMAIFSYLSSLFYSPKSTVLSVLNTLFSERLSFGHDYLNKYSITLLGQKIRRINPDQASKYGIPPEILDNGYLRILLQLGVVTSIVILAIFFYILYRGLKKEHYAVIIGLMVTAIYNVSEFYMTCLFANPFLFFFTYYRYGYAPELVDSKINSDSPGGIQNLKEYCYYGKYIDMKQSLHYLALHWLSILLVTITVIAAACGINLKNQAEAQKSHQEKYPDNSKEITLCLSEDELSALQQFFSDSKLLDTYKAYNSNSLYMAIDANNTPHYTVTYVFSCTESIDPTTASNDIRAAMNTMQQEAKKDTFFNNWAAVSGFEETSSGNLRDLLTITTVNNTQMIVEICAPDVEILNYLADSFISLWENDLFAQTQKLYPTMQIRQENPYIYTSRDTKIRDTQSNIQNQITTYAAKKNNDFEQLSDNAKKYLEKYEESKDISLGEPITYTQKVSAVGISKKKVGIAGIKAGSIAILLLLLFWLVIYMATNRIWGRRTIKYSYQINNLGSFIPDETAERTLKPTNQAVWKFYCNHTARNGKTNQDLSFRLRCLLGLNCDEKIHHVLVLSDALKKCEQMKSQLNEFLSTEIAETVTILSGNELAASGKNSSANLPNNVDAVLITSVMGRSTYANLEYLLSLCSPYGDKMLGYLMIE